MISKTAIQSTALLCILFILLAFIPKESSLSDSKVSTETVTGFALIELFTSQGCSSCPPADANLIRIKSKYAGQKVYPISFHVDYWNRLGWKDPYSDAAYSDRQRAYAGMRNSNRIYTPQMVVNGQDEFVGSSQREAEQWIEKALKSPTEVDLELSEAELVDGTLRFNYQISPLPAGTKLQIAIVEETVATRVKRGENGGRHLKHENVVRAFYTEAANAKGKIEKSIDKARLPEQAKLIAFLQQGNYGAILAATAVEL